MPYPRLSCGVRVKRVARGSLQGLSGSGLKTTVHRTLSCLAEELRGPRGRKEGLKGS